MPATVIRTAEPSAFASVVAASGIGVSPFVLDAPAVLRSPPFLTLVSRERVVAQRSPLPQTPPTRRAS